jgi:hypothetical protein
MKSHLPILEQNAESVFSGLRDLSPRWAAMRFGLLKRVKKFISYFIPNISNIDENQLSKKSNIEADIYVN